MKHFINFLIYTALLLPIFGIAQCNDVDASFSVSQSEFCGAGPHTINFTNTSNGPNANSADYEWIIDGTTVHNSTGLGNPPPQSINGIGVHTIELIASDLPPPCSESFILQVEILPEPIAGFTFNPNNDCAGLPINFTNTSSGINGNTNYLWDFGDGNTSTNENPSHTFAAGGSYTVTLTVENFPGCSNLSSQTVSTLEIPNALIAGDDGDGNTINCLLPGDPTTQQTVDFINYTTGGTSYFWDFGDGNTSTDFEPSHLYTSFGTFNVTMTATGPNGCTSSMTIQVIFEKFVSASLTLDITEYSGCTPHFLGSLQNLSVNATDYIWNFGDGTAPYETNNVIPPNHFYNTPGTYTISLTASNSCNSANATISPITIVGPPVAGFTPSITNGCAPSTISFVNNSTGASPANNYSWDMGNGNTYNSITTPPNQTYLEAGTYDVSLTASNACGDSTVIRTITLDTIPLAIIDADPLEGCSPMTVTFENFSQGNITNYAWYLDGTLYSTDSIIAPITFTETPGNAPITHEVILFVSNSCGTTSDTVEIIVHRPTLANFTASNTLVCEGTPITFTNTSLGEDLTFEWDFGDGTTSTDPGSHTIDYATHGTYDVQLIANGFCGPDTITIQVVVDPIPVAQFDILDPIEGCSPLTVSPTNNSTGVGMTYNWFLDGVLISTDENPGVLDFILPPGNNPVDYLLELTINSACGVETVPETITVHPPTLADFTTIPLDVCLGEEITVTDNSLGENLTWEWDFGDGSTSALEGPHSLTYATDGTFLIELIAEGFCGPDTATTEVTVHPYPIADFSPDLPDGCAVLEMTFTNNSTPTANFNWNFGPNATPSNSVDFNPGTVEFPQEGTEMIVLNVEENGCLASDTAYITIFPLPIVDFTVTPIDGCSPLDASFLNNSTNNGTETYEWDFGNGNTSGDFSPSNEVYNALLNDSTYSISLIVSSGLGCQDSLTQQITVYPLPVADFSINQPIICANNQVETTNNSIGAASYLWDFGDGTTSTDTAPVHQYATDGTYTISLTVTTINGCTDQTDINVTVQPVPVPDFTNTTECLGFETIFTDASTGNITDWLWDFGDGNTSTDQNPSHLYGTSGTFDVILTVENDLGCIESSTQQVLVNTVPVPDFTANQFCLGDETQFSDATIGVTTQLDWDFGDGSPIVNGANPTHIFASIGDYDVMLIAFGGSGCSDTIIQTITITEVPLTDFSFIQACTNDTTFFNDISGGNPDSFFWDFGDGTTSIDQFPNHVYTTAGSYTATLTTSFLASGCASSISYTVEAHPRTIPSFSTNTPCLGAETLFEDLTVNDPIDWNWNFGDGGVATTQNPSYTYIVPGIYEVELITENIYGCIDTISQNVEVFPLPTADFVFDTVCLNIETQFIDNSIDAIDWEYFFGDGTTSNGIPNPTHLYASDGAFNVTQVVTNTVGCTDTLVQTIIVRPNPIALFEIDTACFSYETSFTDLSIDAVNWEWSFGDLGNVSAAQNPTYIYSSDGTYPVQLVVENVFGCLDSLTLQALVLPQPEAVFSNNTVCAGNEVQFTNTSLGNPVDFNWNFGDGSPETTIENPTHTFTLGGNYLVTFIVENNAGCSDTLEQNIEVFTVPNVDFTADTVCLFNITTFTNLSNDVTPIANWYWDFGDGNNSFAENPSYIYQNPGVYTVTLTATNINGCDSTISHDVFVSEIPDANFLADIVCFGSPTTFTDQSTGNPTQWIWNFGDGTVVDGGPVEEHTFATPGNYFVTLYVEGGSGACNDQFSQIITIENEAQAGMIIPTQACVDESFNFQDNSVSTVGTIDDYLWDMGDGTSYSTANGFHAYSDPGVYEITLSVSTDNGCINTTSQEITIYENPIADFESTLACEGQTTLFTDLSTGNIVTWEWDLGDGTITNDVSPSHVYANIGTYSVTLTVTSDQGCTDVITGQVEVFDTPIAAFTNTTVCWGDETEFTDLSVLNNGTIVSWDWDFNNTEGTANTQNPNYTFDEYNDVFDVQLVVTSDNGCTDTILQIVNLNPIVIFDFTSDRITGCEPMEVNFSDNSFTTDENGFIVNYTWDFGDGITSFNQNPNHIYADAGEYTVTLTVLTNTDCLYTDTLSYSIYVYPMPVAGFLVNPVETSIFDPTIDITDISVGADNYEYYFNNNYYSNESEPSVTYTEPGEYVIMQIVQSIHNCIDTAYQAVTINPDLIFYVPNSFTPNDDGRNDFFTWSVEGAESFVMRIFNRWGELVFETEDFIDYWDGKYRETIVQDGVYVWKANVVDLNGEEHVRTGHVTVMR